MSRRNGDRSRFQRQRQAKMLRRKRVAEFKQRLKLATATAPPSTGVPAQ